MSLRPAAPPAADPPPGAAYLGDGRTRFRVWAPERRSVAVHLRGPEERIEPLAAAPFGYWEAEVAGAGPGTRYTFLLDGAADRPDPASHWQPEGVHGPSAVVDHHAFPWSDGVWAGIARERLVLYELHVGAFTPEGTFAAVIPRLRELRDLGVTALELMPVATFPGGRNWGYDGTYPFAVHEAYGGPEGLKTLVDACHREGLAVVLDVVYNHLGPEGNYLGEFGPYFTATYRTPWGEAMNFDGPWSDGVRAYFLTNARHWFTRYRVDGLRLDAIHAIYDASARPFLRELAEEADRSSRELGRPLHLIAENDRNDVRVVAPPAAGGHGLHAEWCDDFHHALHALLTGERGGYYEDFGAVEHLATAFREGFVYSGQYSAYRRRRHGSSSARLGGAHFVVFAQNHDQVGNRRLGERLAALVPFEALKVTAAAVLLAPYLPLLFMGEEYGEPAPFLYFVSHGDPDLVAAVRAGRKAEFRSFGWSEEPPDPQDVSTYERSRLRWELREVHPHQQLRAFHRECLRLRRETPSLADLGKQGLEVERLPGRAALRVGRRHGRDASTLLLNFEDRSAEWSLPRGEAAVPWALRLDSTAEQWSGPGSGLAERLADGAALTLPPRAAALYHREVPA